jgi:hypothetical protein
VTVRRHYPFYTVRMPNNEGCGHQHSSRKQAWNCADNIAHRRHNLAWIEVVKVTNRMGNVGTKTVGRIAQYSRCRECGGVVLTLDDGSIRGHYEDCKVAVTASV